MEAEITSSGDVMVEGQHVGQLNGFRFTADPQAAGEEAKTLNAAAQKALASEIEGRATRVNAAVDEAFVLANDGLIRWLGEPVGRITAGAHILEPQVRVIADEQLTGPALELVQRRLDLWLGQHVKKLLGPLVELEKPEALEGMARGIAFQIAEALGVLERGKVSDDVKNLPQEARGQLRKLGVRFGAYHLYLPALVKPAPRALAAQLWALKNGGLEEVKGVDEVPHLAASGRTSFVADQSVPKGFYRAAGFRVCGERAVRVDILERLADLVRPAIAYRPGTTPGDAPAGTADNDGFVVTVGMTSLAGCSGEAFGSILKSLGYVLDRRAGPAITVPLIPKAATEPVRATEPDAGTAAPDETVAQDAQTDDSGTTGAVEAPSAEATTDDLESRVSLARESELIAAALEGGALEAIEPHPAAAEPVEAPAPQASELEAHEDAPVEPPVTETSGDMPATAAEDTPPVAIEIASEGEPADATPAAPEEPVLIDVWRPHRSNVHNRRPAGDRNRGPRRPQPAPAGEMGAVPDAGVRADRPDGRPDRNKGARDFKRPGGDGGRPGGREQGDKRREPRRDGQGFEGRGFGGKGKGSFGGPKGDRAPSFQTTEKPAPRERAPDPNSPFAKLAALKAQMEKDRT